MTLSRAGWIALIMALQGCGAPKAPTVDAGPEPELDAGPPDAGTLDAGPPDAGAPDAGPPPACPTGTHREDAGSCESRLTGWTEGPALPMRRDHHLTFLAELDAGTFVYVAAGVLDRNTLLKTIERSQLTATGELGAWQDGGSLPNNTAGAGVALVGRTVVVTGGYRDGPSLSKACEVATLNDDGTFGPWTPGPQMAVTRFHHASLAYKGSVYVAGGMTGNNTVNTPSVQRAVVQPNGTLSAWESLTPLPGPRSHFGFAASDDALFVIGGAGVGEAPSSEVLRAGIAPDGTLGNWEAVTPLPAVRTTHSSFVHGGHLYVVGGFGPQLAELSTVLRARILPGATLGPWEPSAALPISRTHNHHTPGAGGRVYSVGGSLGGISQANAWVGTLE